MIRSPIFSGAKVDSVVYLFCVDLGTGAYRFDGSSFFKENMTSGSWEGVPDTATALSGYAYLFSLPNATSGSVVTCTYKNGVKTNKGAQTESLDGGKITNQSSTAAWITGGQSIWPNSSLSVFSSMRKFVSTSDTFTNNYAMLSNRRSHFTAYNSASNNLFNGGGYSTHSNAQVAQTAVNSLERLDLTSLSVYTVSVSSASDMTDGGTAQIGNDCYLFGSASGGTSITKLSSSGTISSTGVWFAFSAKGSAACAWSSTCYVFSYLNGIHTFNGTTLASVGVNAYTEGQGYAVAAL